MKKYTIETAVKDVLEELDRANKIHPPFNSRHEGYAILLEEMDELWDEIKKNVWQDSLTIKEAIQVAAMAIKMMISPIWKD